MVKTKILFFTTKYTSTVTLGKICSAVRQAARFSGLSAQSGAWGKRFRFNGAEFDSLAALSWTENSVVNYRTPSIPNFECFIACRPLLCPQLFILQVNLLVCYKIKSAMWVKLGCRRSKKCRNYYAKILLLIHKKKNKNQV